MAYQNPADASLDQEVSGTDRAATQPPTTSNSDDVVPEGTVTRESNYRPGERSPAEDARSRSEEARNQRSTQRPQAWMGVTLDDAQDQNGVRVGRIYPSGPASRAGLRGNDVIVRADDRDVTNSEEFDQYLDNAQPGQEMELTVMRDGQEKMVTIVPGNRSEYIGPRYDRESQEMANSRDYDNGQQMSAANVPEHSMMLEQHRRLAEQHQRIEERLDRVLNELEALRKQMANSKQNR